MLVLHNRTFMRGSPQRRALELLAMLTVLLTIAAIALLYVIIRKTDPAPDTGGIPAELWQRVLDDPRALFVLVATPLALGFFFLLAVGSRARERVLLSESGIEYRSPFAAPLNFLQRDWALQWHEVRSASVGKMFRYAGGHLAALILDTGARRRRLVLYPWVEPDTYQPRSLRAERAHMRALQREGPEFEAWIGTHPIVGYIREHVRGVEVDTAPATSSAYALEKNPWTLGTVALFFLLAIYALIDGFFLLGETYAVQPPYDLFVGMGVLGTTIAIIVLRHKGIPMLEGTVLGLLTAAALGCALYPGLLRLNQWTDTAGLQAHSYESRGDGWFVPLDETLPELRFDDYPEYWRQVAAGERYDFELRRGALGFYQLNLAPIHEAMADFYRSPSARASP